MSKRGLLWLTLLLPVSAAAQGANEGYILESEAARHQLNAPAPVYPPIAKAAHVQGSVLLHVFVDVDGKVTGVEAVGGPDLLKYAAIAAVKTWSYQPFLRDGQPAAVKVIVSVPFSLGIPPTTEKTDQAIGRAYFPQADLCRSANARNQWETAVRLCGDLVKIAERFPDPGTRANEVRSAYEEYGEALIYTANPSDALQHFQKAVAIANTSLTPKDADYAEAYYWQAFAEHALGQRAEAERDYTLSTESYRSAMLNLPDMKTVYGRNLAHVLAFHSVLVRQTGHADEAIAMRNEAQHLDPHALDGMAWAQ